MLVVQKSFLRALKKSKRQTFTLELTKDYHKHNPKFELYYDPERNEAGLRGEIPAKFWALGKEKIVITKITRNAMLLIVELILALLNQSGEKFSILHKGKEERAWEIGCNFDKTLSLTMMVQEIARYQRLLKPMQKKNPLQALVERLPLREER